MKLRVCVCVCVCVCVYVCVRAVSTLYTREKKQKKRKEKLTQSPEMLQVWVWLTSESKLACLTLWWWWGYQRGLRSDMSYKPPLPTPLRRQNFNFTVLERKGEKKEKCNTILLKPKKERNFLINIHFTTSWYEDCCLNWGL